MTVPLPIRDGTSRLKQLPHHARSEALHYKHNYLLLGRKLLRTPSRPPGNVPLRFFYTRYADDWLLLVKGSPGITRYIRNKAASFLKYHLGLTLSLEKTKITDIKVTPALFLSFSIKLQKQHIKYTSTGTAKRVGGVKPYIGIDHQPTITHTTSMEGFSRPQRKA